MADPDFARFQDAVARVRPPGVHRLTDGVLFITDPKITKALEEHCREVCVYADIRVLAPKDQLLKGDEP